MLVYSSMDKATFWWLHRRNARHWARSDYGHRRPINSAKCLAAALAFLAQGASYRFLANQVYGIGVSTMCVVVRRVIYALLEHMYPEQLVLPFGNDLLDVAADFEQESRLPNCIGAIDGTFFHIQAPPHTLTNITATRAFWQ